MQVLGWHWGLSNSPFQILLLAAIIDNIDDIDIDNIDDMDIDNIDIDNIENIDASLCKCESWDDTMFSPIPPSRFSSSPQ